MGREHPGAGPEPELPESYHSLPPKGGNQEEGWSNTSGHTDPRVEKEETIASMGSNITPPGTLLTCAMCSLTSKQALSVAALDSVLKINY